MNVLIPADCGDFICEQELIVSEWRCFKYWLNKNKENCKKNFRSFEICKDSVQVLWVQELNSFSEFVDSNWNIIN